MRKGKFETWPETESVPLDTSQKEKANETEDTTAVSQRLSPPREIRIYRDIVTASYDGKPKKNIGSFTLNESLSSHTNRVYESEDTIILSIRGTNRHDLKDIQTDALALIGGSSALTLTKNHRYTSAHTLAGELKSKATREHKKLIAVGHSLGGYIASSLSNEVHEVHTWNKMTGILDLPFETKNNEYDTTNLNDWLTILNVYQKHTNGLIQGENKHTFFSGGLKMHNIE